MQALVQITLLSIFALTAATVKADPMVLRIGTGGSAGTYFPIGTLLSESISDTQIKLDAKSDNPTPVVALAQRSNGSAANVHDIENGLLEGALSQADVAYWAYNATGPFASEEPMTSLRTLASLYPESIHFVVRTNSGIESVGGLVGRNVAIDEIGSGTLFDVGLVLSAFDIELEDIKPVYLKLKDSIDRLKQNELDAFIFVAGYPVQQIVELVNEGNASVIPIEGSNIDRLVEQHPFFSTGSIPSGMYKNATDISTVSVSAQLIVSATLDENLVYELSKALWSDQSRKLLNQGHPKGKDILIENAITGVAIPLHQGAKRFYEERSIDTSNTPDGPID